MVLPNMKLKKEFEKYNCETIPQCNCVLCDITAQSVASLILYGLMEIY